MSDLNAELLKWFDEIKKLPADAHLLCPKLGDDDDEDYRLLDDPGSGITAEVKQERIKQGQERLNITYWNSLIFGFDKAEAGKWLDDFTGRLNACLGTCADCVLNWHMQRKPQMRKFAERWEETTASSIQSFLEDLDVKRISHNVDWARKEVDAVEAKGDVFKKSHFGDKIGFVHITVYEALCCMPYLRDPERISSFQKVFATLQGKKYLKLGTKDPLPGMAFFLFDRSNEQRRNWAELNWQAVNDGAPLTEEQFDWAVTEALTKSVMEMQRRESAQGTSESFLEIQQFWQAVEKILNLMSAGLIHSRLGSLEVQPSLYDLLFGHIQYCKSEGVLVATIRVMKVLLLRSPKAIWDFVGEARPNVIADLIFGNPVFKLLLRQSLEDCWTDYDISSENDTPFATSWVIPWLQSLGLNRKYDACDILMHTLFEGLARDQSIGEAGQAACIRAGLDALKCTMHSFLDAEINIGNGTPHTFANATFNLVSHHREMIMRSVNPAAGDRQGWETFKLAPAAMDVMEAGMKLDMKLFAEEYLVLNSDQAPQAVDPRGSKSFWESVLEIYDRSNDPVQLATIFLHSLAPIVAVEQIRPLKARKDDLSPHAKAFNGSLTETVDAITRIMTRVSDLDHLTDLNTLLSDEQATQVVVALSLQGDSDFAEASMEVLKNWTGELSRSAAFESMCRQHPETSLTSLIWSLERIMRPPDPWGPIRPLLNLNMDVLRGLTDASNGVLRKEAPPDNRFTSILLRWWTVQWRFVSTACHNVNGWSQYIPNNIMTEFCREIMELAEALIAEDGLIASAHARSTGKDEQKAMAVILEPTKKRFAGMENMIRLRDYYLVEVTVKVLGKILTRLRENDLQISDTSREFILDACARQAKSKYLRQTNLSDAQRAELLRALGHEEEIQIVKITARDSTPLSSSDKSKKQSRLDAWSKAGPHVSSGSGRTNRDDVNDLSKSLKNPILKQVEAQKARGKPLVPDQRAISALKASREREKAEKKRRDAEAIAQAKRIRGETVPGEGSGLIGLGVIGKDHGRSEIMVNDTDDEDDDDSDSDDDGQIVALSTGGAKAIDEAEKRRRQALLDKTKQPVKKQRRTHNAKEMRARLIPPMDRLHNIILAWDLFHKGKEPPSGPAASKVATKYSDPRAYQDTFLPLLASESWRSFVTAKDESTSQPFEMKIASRASVDSYLEVTFSMPIVQYREKGVHEGDIILVSEAQQPLSSPESKSCLARVQRAKFKLGNMEITYRVTPRNNALATSLNPSAIVYGLKITSMTTIEREYAALESLQYYDLMEEILKAEPSPILRYSDEKLERCSSNWSLNRAQAMAVLGAGDNDGFTLIQGPPGTGKTKTIIAMVGALLSEQFSQAKQNGTPIGAPVRPSAASQVHSQVQGQGQNRPKKLLVCAPSNAAVDELVLRLKGGVKSTAGKIQNISVVRLGRVDAMSATSVEVSLDEQVRVRLEGDTSRDKAKEDREKLHEEAGKLKHELMALRTLLDQQKDAEDRTEYRKLSAQFDAIKKRQMEIGKRIDADKDSAQSKGRELEIMKAKVRQEILNSAHVICATLSGSGHEMFRNLDVEFETVIIDEAAQCVELSALIPLKYGCYKCILVGDPKQLPPTVLSRSAADFGYDQSLFVRMQQNFPKSVHLLDTQYRMHPEISNFPREEFYEGQLKDGSTMARDRLQPWHRTALLSPYRFFDIQGVQERGRKGSSLVNTKELEAALQIYQRFRQDFKSHDVPGKIGIITPYKAQLFELRRRFEALYGEGITSHIEFNTTDAFQGRECEIIIFSCVRASPTGGIGFMTDIRRMNVGLTRAKSSLWILGDARALNQGEYWNKLILDAKKRDRFTGGDIVGMLRRPLKLMEGASPPPLPQGAVSELEDITMDDAPVTELSINTKQTQAPTTAAEIKPSNNLATERGTPTDVVPRNGGPPTIHSSSDKSKDTEGKKRPHDDGDPSQPTVKRVANERPRTSLMNKFGGQRPAPRPVKAPTDPSAMSALGMTPPERPMPMPTSMSNSNSNPNPKTTTTTSNGSTSHQTNDGERPRPPNRPPGPPMPRKKAKPSLFINKRR